MKVALITLALVCATAHVVAGEEHHEGPCKKLKEACVAAGFKKGEHKSGKGLHLDCMKPVLEGKTVAGVTVSAEDIAACKVKAAEHHR